MQCKIDQNRSLLFKLSVHDQACLPGAGTVGFVIGAVDKNK